MVSTNPTTIRHAVLSVLIAVILVSAGCNGLSVGETETGANGDAGPTTTVMETITATSTPTATATPTPTPDPDALDLREIQVQVSGSEDYAPNTLGEIDRADPTNQDGHYEPVAFAARANDTINVTASATGGDPKVELRAPNGTTLNIDDDGGLGDAASIEEETLPVTGRYTVLVSPADDSSSKTFTYRLTVDRRAYEGELKSEEPEESEETKESEEIEEPDTQNFGWYAGPLSTWNKSERYAEWANDFAAVANDTYAATNAEPDIWVNTEQDYAVITLIGWESYNASQNQEITASLALTNVDNYKYYVNDTNQPENASWIPDQTYVRFVTPKEREVYRMTALGKKAAAIGANQSGHGAGPSIDSYFISLRQGPANQYYDEGAETSVQNRFSMEGVDAGTELKPPESDRPSMNRTTLVNGTLVDTSALNETGLNETGD